MKPIFLVATGLLLITSLMAQKKFFIEKDFRTEWMTYKDDKYVPISEDNSYIGNTVYFNFIPGQFKGGSLVLKSSRPFFIFFNGKLSGEYRGQVSFNIDSVAGIYFTRSLLVAIHQKSINSRDLKTWMLSERKETSGFAPPVRPSTYFKDFVIVAGLVIIIVFLVISRLNPKLASDYFSVIRVFSLREGDDAQSNARLTGSTNIQFYISCSLLLGFYLMIIFHHLPGEYALPLYFQGHSFGAVVWQWIRLSTVILGAFFLKILFIFLLTRLFGLRGMARIHFFNWVRLLLIVFGGSSVILFIYFILRGQSPGFFAVFLSLVVATLTAWVAVAFLKLNGKSEHSMFHLFSYICATEIIPLLITIKVLFQ
jgi:hypothetical protein